MRELSELAMTDVGTRDKGGRVWKLGLTSALVVFLYVLIRNVLYVNAGMLKPNFGEIPVMAGVILGGKKRNIEVQSYTAVGRVRRQLTERSSLALILNYRHQNSKGQQYPSFDRYEAMLQFSFTFDPIRF